MESHKKACVINVGIGSWYPKGQQRLVRSLDMHGWNWDILTWTDWPNNNFDKACIYNAKAAAFEETIKQGYTHILWMDCSMWVIGDPNKMMDIINDEGYYIGMSGFNCANVCSDRCLQYFGVDRDTAETYPDGQTGCFGVNLENPIAKEFINTWLKAAKDKVFHGSREHDNQSSDPRFMFHRQDQACASVIANKLGMKLTPFGQLVSYYPADLDKVIFTCRGM